MLFEFGFSLDRRGCVLLLLLEEEWNWTYECHFLHHDLNLLRAHAGDGGRVAVQVVSKTFLMVCEHIKRDKMESLWGCLVDHICGTLSCKSSSSVPPPDPEATSKDSTKCMLQNETLVVGDSLDPSLNPGEDATHIMQDKCLSNSGPGPPVNIVEEKALHLNDPQSENDQMHLVHLLSLLTDVLEFRKGSRVNGKVLE